MGRHDRAPGSRLSVYSRTHPARSAVKGTSSTRRLAARRFRCANRIHLAVVIGGPIKLIRAMSRKVEPCTLTLQGCWTLHARAEQIAEYGADEQGGRYGNGQRQRYQHPEDSCASIGQAEHGPTCSMIGSATGGRPRVLWRHRKAPSRCRSWLSQILAANSLESAVPQ